MARLNDDDKTIVSQASRTGKMADGFTRHCPKCGLAVAASTNVCPQDGTQIFETHEGALTNKYEFITVTGSGGMSVVYKARRRENGDIVAIKMMHSLLMNDQAMKRFEQEAKAITSLRHPNIINVHDSGVSEHGQPYMVMDFIEGSTLADVIKEKGGLTLEESLHRFIQLCDALEHAHELGVLHRDLKPSNIMISNRDGNFADARIVDFGIAKLLDKETEQQDDGHLTRTGELFGSPLYMSPEQCRGAQVDARTDIYSMGCVMYETLTGLPPLKGASMVETFVLQMTEVPPQMSEVCKDKTFPDELEAVIAKALAKDPDDRYQTMTDLEYALMQIQPNMSSQSAFKPKRTRQNKPLSKTAVVGIASGIVGFIAATIIVPIILHNFAPSQTPTSKDTNALNIGAQDSGANNTATPSSQNAGATTGNDNEDYVKRNRESKKIFEKGDPNLPSLLSDEDLGATSLDLSEAHPPITDKSGVLLSNFRGLTDLDLDDNQIGNLTLRAVRDLPLTKLSLRRTRINDVGIFELCHHAINSRLQELYLTGCGNVGNESIRSIGEHMRALKRLAISELKFDNANFAKLAELHLEYLAADLTGVGDAGVSTLGKMTSLTELQLNYTPTGDTAISHLTGLQNLETLGIAHTDITDKSAPYLATLQHLKSLDLGGTNITGRGLSQLKKLSGLTDLALYNSEITDKELEHLDSFPKLTSLNLASSPGVTDAAIDQIVKHKSLTALDIGGTSVTDRGLKKLADLPNLHTLVLYGLPVTMAGVRALQQKNPELHIKLLYPHKDEYGFFDDPRNFNEFPHS